MARAEARVAEQENLFFNYILLLRTSVAVSFFLLRREGIGLYEKVRYFTDCFAREIYVVAAAISIMHIFFRPACRQSFDLDICATAFYIFSPIHIKTIISFTV